MRCRQLTQKLERFSAGVGVLVDLFLSYRAVEAVGSDGAFLRANAQGAKWNYVGYRAVWICAHRLAGKAGKAEIASRLTVKPKSGVIPR